MEYIIWGDLHNAGVHVKLRNTMKIGILTQPLHSNYGGLLQNYALQQVLKRMGHNVLTIDWSNNNSSLQWCIDYCKSLTRFLLMRPAQFPLSPTKINYMRKHTNLFIASHIATTKAMHRISAKKMKQYEFDAYIVGSDQVWRLTYNAHIEWMYLSFAKNESIKRIAYAASVGIDYWDYPKEKSVICATLAQRFDAISVRESDATLLVKDNLNMPAQHVLDPTLLLNNTDYEQLLSLETIKFDKSIAIYILDMNDSKKELLDYLQKHLNCKINVIGNPNAHNNKLNYRERQSPSVEDWLNGIRKADYVITDSFHGTVFSIIFHKQFVCLGNRARGNSRFKSLLEMAGLENRQIDQSEVSNYDAISCCLCAPIDWGKVDLQKQRMQKISHDFLMKNLQK